MTETWASNEYQLLLFRDSNGHSVPSQQPHAMATARQTSIRKSDRNLDRRAASGDLDARLDRWPMQEVQRSLQNIRVAGSNTSLLSWLERPNMEKSESAREVLEYLAEQAEEEAMSVALVWRYAKEHQVWKSCTNPQWQTEDGFLASLVGHQTVRICIMFGTSTETARQSRINLIQYHWGDKWYERSMDRTLLEQKPLGALGLSAPLLRKIADMSKTYSLEQAWAMWDEAIRKRTSVGSRMQYGLKAATTTHLMTSDLTAITDQDHRNEAPSRKRKSQKTRKDDDEGLDEILELRSSSGHSSLSPFNALSRAVHPSSQSYSATTATKRARKKSKSAKAREIAAKQSKTFKSRLVQSDKSESDRGSRGNTGDSCDEDNNSQSDRISQESSTTSRRSRISKQEKAVEQATARAQKRHNDVTTTDHPSLELSVQVSRPLMYLRAKIDELRALSTNEKSLSQPARLRDSSYKEIMQRRSIPNQIPTATPSTQDLIDPLARASEVDSVGSLVNPASTSAHEDDRLEDCALCHKACVRCTVPACFTGSARANMFESAHRAQELATGAPDETLEKWVCHIRFASLESGVPDEPGELLVLSPEEFNRFAEAGQTIDRPFLIRERFLDSDEWTPARYARILASTLADLEVDVQWHGSALPRREKSSKMAQLCRSQITPALSADPPNLLNLPDLTGAIVPSFLRLDRFRLLDLAVERSKAAVGGYIGKQTLLTPFDIGGGRRFNLLGWPGAFSAPHMDSNGATWVRNLCGHKLWMFVPDDKMTPQDWEEFAKDGDRWCPGDKARAVLLGPGDALGMRCGLIHAVQTLGDSGPCLMAGGFFLDSLDLIRSLDKLHWIGTHQNNTNEPIPFQLADVLAIIEGLVDADPETYFVDEAAVYDFKVRMQAMRSLGCRCDDCAEDCSCTQEGRRCTPLCASHSYDAMNMLPCFMEDTDEKSSEGGNQGSDEDFAQ